MSLRVFSLALALGLLVLQLSPAVLPGAGQEENAVLENAENLGQQENQENIVPGTEDEDQYSFTVTVVEGENLERAGAQFGEALVEIGEPFLLVVTIANTGQLPDNYSLDISHVVGDFQYPETVSVGAGENVSIEVSGVISDESVLRSSNLVTIRVTNSRGETQSVELTVWVLPEPGFNERYLMTGAVVVIMGIIIVVLLSKGPLAG